MRCSADDSCVARRHDDSVVAADGTCDVAELIRIGRDREAAEQGSTGRVTRCGGPTRAAADSTEPATAPDGAANRRRT